jgi:hypothetical protein
MVSRFGFQVRCGREGRAIAEMTETDLEVRASIAPAQCVAGKRKPNGYSDLSHCSGLLTRR